MASKLASGYVELGVQYASAQKQIAKDFKGFQSDAEKASDKAGTALSNGLNDAAAKGVKAAGQQIVRADFAKTLSKELGSAGDKASRELLRSLAAGNEQAKRNAAVAGRNYAQAFAGSLKGEGRGAAEKWEREFRDALDARDASQAFYDEFHRDGIARGQRVGNAMGKAVSAGIRVGMAGATAAVAAIGYTLTKGFQRLEKIDQARFKLQALGNSSADVDEIMKNAEASVKGTAFALDEAASSAASAVAAGVRPGKQLTKYLTTVADTAAIAGTSFEEMASIFNKVTTSNKAYTDDLRMLADRGVPVFQYLQEQYGVSAEGLQKMVEDGKVSAEDFSSALEGKIGGSAQKMGESFSGAMDNMHASVARLGANFLAAAFGADPGKSLDAPKDAVNALTEQLNKAGEWVKAHGGEIHQFFIDAKEVGKAFIDAVGPPLKTVADTLREHPDLIVAVVAAFAAWKTIEGIAAVTTALKGISTLLSVTIPASAATGAAATATSWAPVFAAFRLLPLAGVGLGGVKDSSELGLPQVHTSSDGKLSFMPPQGGGPNASNERRGLPTVGPFGAGGGSIVGDILKGGGSSTSSPIGGNALDGGFFMPGSSSAGGPLQDFLNSGVSGGGGNSLVGAAPANRPVNHQSAVDQIAASFGLTKTSGTRAGDGGYHGSGHAGDYSGSVADMQRFATYMSQNFGGRLAEIIFDAPGWAGNVKNGQNTGAFGNVYTMGQAGYHGDHVHIAWAKFAGGGSVSGPGGPKDDKIPAMLSDDEHVWTAQEVAAVGGQSEMYRLRAMALRGLIPGFSKGGAVLPLGYVPGPNRPNDPTGTGPGGTHWDPSTGIPPELWFPFEDRKGIRTNAPNWGVRGSQGFWGWKFPDWFKHGQPDTKRDKTIRVGTEPGDYGDLPVRPPQHAPWPDQGGRDPMRPGTPWDPADDWQKLLFPRFADGGEVSLEELLKQGIDPNTTEHGQAQGAAPGPTPEQLQQIGAQLSGQNQQHAAGARTEGYIPAAAGSTSVAGTSFLSGLYGTGAEVINGVIDQAASAASTAAGAALAAGTMGAGAAGAPAAAAATQAAIGMGTQAAKRGVQYGAQMLGIGTDALIEQLTPFGAPRILSTDPTSFMPQQAIMSAATTSIEKMFAPPQQPGQQHPLAAPAPAQHQGTGALPGPITPPAQHPLAPPPAANAVAPSVDPMAEMLRTAGVYDSGGWLPPDGIAINKSSNREPLPVFNHEQWGNISAIANSPVADLDPTASGATYDYRTIIESVTVKDVAELERQMEDRRRLNTLRHRGRPTNG